MPVSDAKKRANKKWNDAHPYGRITFLVQPDEKEAIRAAAAGSGESISEYSKNAVFQRMDAEKKAGGQ